MNTWSRRAGATVLTLSVALAAAGCGLRADERARAIPKSSIPIQLSEQIASTTTTALSPVADQRLVYLVRNQGTAESLVSKPVVIRSAVSPDELPRVIIDQLVANPPVDDKSDVTSAIPPGTRVRSVVRDGDVLDIDLTNLGSIESTRQRLAVAQIVFTATEIPGIRGVRFSIDGTPSAVPLDDKSSDVNAIITRDNFPKLGTGAASNPPAAPAAADTTDPTSTTVAPDS
jgi:spore germination protein GerM